MAVIQESKEKIYSVIDYKVKRVCRYIHASVDVCADEAKGMVPTGVQCIPRWTLGEHTQVHLHWMLWPFQTVLLKGWRYWPYAIRLWLQCGTNEDNYQDYYCRMKQNPRCHFSIHR